MGTKKSPRRPVVRFFFRAKPRSDWRGPESRSLAQYFGNGVSGIVCLLTYSPHHLLAEHTRKQFGCYSSISLSSTINRAITLTDC